MTTSKRHVLRMQRQQVLSMWWTLCLMTSSCCSMIHVAEARHPWLASTRNQTPFHRPQLPPHARQQVLIHQSHRLSPSLLLLRGGASSSTSSSSPTNNKKKSSKKKKSGKTSTKKKSTKTKSSSSKDEIASVLQEDAASAMGDAIRNRADQLLQSSTTEGDNTHTPSIRKSTNPLVDQIDQTVSSVGWALGASDRFSTLLQQNDENVDDATTTVIDEETGGVETSTTAVLVHYFLKSHGGAHAVQCLCSLVATVTGVLAILWPFIIPTQSASGLVVLGQTLLQRCMLFAMMKHVSGLLAASVATAKAIPQVGLRNARLWIHDLVQDPVSQYVFYTASVLWWLRTSTASSSRWWQSWKTLPLVVAGPVVLREWISTMLVLSDVLVLWVCTNQKDEDKGAAITVVQSLLKVGQKGMDALMSLLVTPTVWRPATAAQRQAILAKLTSRTSLLLEVLVGLFMTVDFVVLALQKFVATSSTSATAPISFMTILKVGLCAQLYLQFLWVRRRKISKVATKIRGGAAQFPMYVLDILLDPVAAMGLGSKENAAKPSSTTIESSSKKTGWTLKDYLVTGLGLD